MTDEQDLEVGNEPRAATCPAEDGHGGVYVLGDPALLNARSRSRCRTRSTGGPLRPRRPASLGRRGRARRCSDRVGHGPLGLPDPSYVTAGHHRFGRAGPSAAKLPAMARYQGRVRAPTSGTRISSTPQRRKRCMATRASCSGLTRRIAVFASSSTRAALRHSKTTLAGTSTPSHPTRLAACGSEVSPAGVVDSLRSARLRDRAAR